MGPLVEWGKIITNSLPGACLRHAAYSTHTPAAGLRLDRAAGPLGTKIGRDWATGTRLYRAAGLGPPRSPATVNAEVRLGRRRSRPTGLDRTGPPSRESNTTGAPRLPRPGPPWPPGRQGRVP
jgi:hypothetical protein